MLSVADTDLLRDGSMTVMKSQVVGLVGGNGCGKSTLLKCIAGRRALDDGAIAISSDLEVGYFEQTAVSGSELTVYQEARARMTRINAAEAALRAAELQCESAEVEEACKGADAYMAALEEFDAAGGNGAEKRIASVLDGLGFARSQWDVVCDDLSGGWQMRVALARLLLSPAGSQDNGLLLLDEPTNHLDEASKKWLSAWIKSSPSTTVIVSHEKELLDGACSHIAEVRGKGLHWYVGNYTAFLEARDERIRVAKALYEKQRVEAAELEDFVRRFSANASKASQAQSRAKLLEKLRLMDPPASDNDVLELRGPGPGGGAKLGYDARAPILQGALKLERGQRIVVLGPNGAGKSTLLKSLAGTLPVVGGERVVGERVKIGVFSQDLAQELPSAERALDYVLASAREDDALLKEEKARNALGALGMSGHMALRTIGSLSGGEKARVALAAFVLRPRNVLLLDEPSNHLDIGAVNALTDGLRGWEGTVFAVSHNKEFCEALEPSHVVRVKAGEMFMENCYGLSDADFEHEVVAGDATALVKESGAIIVESSFDEEEGAAVEIVVTGSLDEEPVAVSR
ncbi:ATP-binding cassette superfamily [Micromonas pusilla CCMP1545]|uniref:ATP-binding cassette superfamily n=1 Tax=Micromonas pusilla (strain CCMP1545) TaxID=564608 RepID=C1MQP5_MICPC|nr:ATP-binding cassette superfamily [Micromonas pusilla CCMP1545]EEH58112.1 ATP-binding cassette superfamily [Micromonas pusilla CCMP1545]|eukprot:XP_003058161.1 ATP-binding cassette superfamily [Micromonas pusilla CCMP1545]